MKREETVLEVVSSCIRAEHLNQLSALVGKEPAVMGPVLAQLLPLLIRALADRAGRAQGVEFVWNLVQQAQTNQALVQLDAMEVARWDDRGVRLVQNLLGDSYETTTYRLANKAGLPLAAYAPVLEVGVAAVLGALGRYTTEHGLNPTELSEWLQAEVLPAGGSVISPPSAGAATTRPLPSPQAMPAKQAPAPTFAAQAGKWQEVGGGSIFIPQQASASKANKQRWVWPLLLLLGLALGYGIFRWTYVPLQASTEPTVPVAYAGTAAQPTSVPAPPAATPADAIPAGHYDSATDTYIYDTGRPLVITLFNGSTLKVGVNSTEYQLYRFLADPTQQVDPLNAGAGWITADRMYFAPDQATLTPASTEQLRNLATILRTFPRAQLLFGGYTDSSSNLKNRQLSEAQAQAAVRALIAQGISARRLQAIGYGEAAPVTSNSSPEGRALNRRLLIKVINKLGPLLPPAEAGSTPPLLAAAKPTDSTRLPISPALAAAAGEGPVEPVIEQEEADSRYVVSVQMAYLFTAPTQAKPTKKYLRKGDILYGVEERSGLVKIRFWNPDSALATGWLKRRELQKLSEEEAVPPTQTDSKSDSSGSTSSDSDGSASTVAVPEAAPPQASRQRP
ncbi:OmpA family protein [Hymenobacter tibetensis]|uniref:OmpA family protein n=1 Tax=Hymenobacter tibetensis TaxID=497967 RepID=A0ABY4D2K3_9BACT|nr:OmpA family protein [Hymenobacter tibetensis]UOG76531.1 OmpA family protein [Hymenobacter tibetensis]